MLPETVEQRRERQRLQTRKWRANNRERWNAYQRKRKKENPETFKKYRETYEAKNAERIAELNKKSRLRRKDKIAEINKKYYYQHREALIKRASEYEKERCAKDPAFKCKKRLRNRIVEVLKRQDVIKSESTMQLIGCDRDFLVKWIESKFTEGMTWENHGNRGWHIDHIIPCASFDLSDIEQQRKCFHFTNLQPLWAKENKIKGDKCHYQNT